jgi:outer membrane biosynthesis protein TonB
MAEAVLKAWRFEPATQNGTRVPMIVEVELTFTLK